MGVMLPTPKAQSKKVFLLLFVHKKKFLIGEIKMPKVLISDKLSPAAIEIFKDRGVEVDVKTGLTAGGIAGDYW